MWVIWESALLERFVKVVSSFGVAGGAGRRWIVSGRARKRACRRDQSASCHCDDYVRVCEWLGFGIRRVVHTMMVSSREPFCCFWREGMRIGTV
jgi:hypothetical protein